MCASGGSESRFRAGGVEGAAVRVTHLPGCHRIIVAQLNGCGPPVTPKLWITVSGTVKHVFPTGNLQRGIQIQGEPTQAPSGITSSNGGGQRALGNIPNIGTKSATGVSSGPVPNNKGNAY